MFLIEKGNLHCFIKKDDEEIKVKEQSEGDAFGELCLLYNAPRAATIRSVSDCVCWALDRATFNNIVKESARKRVEVYEEFLKKVPLLETMNSYERNKLCDAFVPQS